MSPTLARRLDRGHKVNPVSGSDPKPQRFYAEDLQEVSVVLHDGSTLSLKAKDGYVETSDPFGIALLKELADTDGHPLTAEKAQAKVSDSRQQRE